MPKIFEDLLLRGINKDVGADGLDYSGRRVLNPLRDCLNARYFSSEGDQTFLCESIKGTLRVNNPDLTPTMAPLASWQNAPWTPVGTGLQWSATPAVSLTTSFPRSAQLIGAMSNIYPGVRYTFQVGWQNTQFGSQGTITMRILFLNANGEQLASVIAATVPSTTASRTTTVTIESPTLTPAYVGLEYTLKPFNSASQASVRITSVSIQTPVPWTALPGQSETIGLYENQERNLLIYFVWNSTGRHRICKLDGNTGIKSVIIEDVPDSSAIHPGRGVLNFERTRLITGIGMVGDLLFWTNHSTGVHCLNISQQYSTTNRDYKLALHKLPPTTKPTILKPPSNPSIPKTKSGRLPAVQLNRLATDSVQFAARYVYIDNMVSCLGPYSDLIPAESYSVDKAFQALRNKITVSIANETDKQAPLIKSVELLYRIGNSENWFIWHRFEAPFSGSSLQADFYNDTPGEAVATQQTAKLFDLIPTRARALTLFKNRLFLNVDEEGMEDMEATVTPSLSDDINSIDVATNGNDGFLKKNGQYHVGVVAFDHFGRATGVFSKAPITGSPLAMSPGFDMFNSTPGQSDALNRAAKRLNVAVAGSLPKEAARWSLVLTEEQRYASYFQTVARLDFYVKDHTDEPIDSSQTRINGRIYLRSADLLASKPWTYCHFFLPLEIPVPVDNTYFVRIINSNNIHVVERVIDVIGGSILVTGKFAGHNFSSGFKRWGGAVLQSAAQLLANGGVVTANAMGVAVFIEVFKLKESPTLFFYEVAGPFNKNAQGMTATLSDIPGDTYYRGGYTAGLNPEAGTPAIPVDMASGNYDVNYRAFRFAAVGSGEESPRFQAQARETTALIQQETPSPTYIAGGGVNAQTGSNLFQSMGVSSNLKKKGYTPDYSKAAWSRGRTFVEVKPRKVRRPCTIRFSDVYQEGTQINGLNSFPVENEYNKIGEDRSPITKLQPVGNVILAIHERNITSLYVGEGILRAGDTGFLSKTDDVVGDDRKLIGGYGSIHPESIQENDGQVFGWDIHNGVVWRYTVEGIIPISEFGMKTFFRDVARKYLPVKDQVRFVSAIDKQHQEYLLVLPTVTIDGQLVVGETWAFNYRHNVWVQRYSFVPEYMGRLGKRLFGFRDGEPWEHNINSQYNMFYGTFEDRKIVWACNFQPDKVKTWSAIQIAAERIAPSNLADSVVVEFSNDPEGQATFTRARDFKLKEGVWYGPILKDVNTNPALLPPGRVALRHGKDMRSKSLLVTLHDETHLRARLQKVTLVAEYSEFST